MSAAAIALNPIFTPQLGDELGARLSSLQIHTMQPTAYTVRTLTTDDKESVLQFLRRLVTVDIIQMNKNFKSA